MATTLIGVFPKHSEADVAVDDLQDLGINTKDISVITRGTELAHEDKRADVAEGVLSGATTGGIIGGVAGLLIGVGVITIPGLGAVLIGGPIAAALGLTGAVATTLSGAVTGVLAGGLVGVLVALGIPEEEARVYEDRIKRGGTLIAVPITDKNEAKARDILRGHSAQQVRAVDTSF